ncbi:glycosyltransferase family 2 protein, partial [candidate division KSB1 bacterium]|nr:glycosyltransferase family 2 protein [candidate division KSB1 bacterium]
MRTPLVYGIILNFNGKPLLLETLASVTQIVYPNFKIIVVDNGSTDDSQA